MSTSVNLIIISMLAISGLFSGEAKLYAKSAIISNQSINKSNIQLTIESEEDIYGIQFDIRYNASELSITEDAIVSKVSGVKTYSRIRDAGIARVLMFGMSGEKLLDVTADMVSDLIDIQFKPKEKFKGISVVELLDITFAGKAGTEIDLDSSSSHVFEISFMTPQSTSLSKNYPNPFNPTTNIDYEISEAGMVSLVICDLKGSVVKSLIDGYQEAKGYKISWDGLNNSGQAVSSGRYILKMTTLGFSDTVTMTLLK